MSKISLKCMNILQLFKPKDKRCNHSFTDDDRDNASLTVQMNKLQKERIAILKAELEHQRKLQEQRHIEEEIDYLKAQLEPDDDDETDYEEDKQQNPIAMFSELISNVSKLSNKQQSQSVPMIQELSDETIISIIRKIPKKNIVEFRKLDIDKQKAQIKQLFPDYNEVTINKALTLLSTVNI